MAIVDSEVIDSQFIADNIGFLDNCFDNSFVLHSSLQVVKEHAADQQDNVPKKSQKIHKKSKSFIQKSTLLHESQNTIKSQTEKRNRLLKDWGLPLDISKKYEERGITEMFDWQVSCLGNPKVLFECRNLVYSAPTSAGKTLVAEILTIKTILERQKKVIIILPFVSIVREKMFYFQDILSSSGIRVEGFMGSQSPPGGLQAVHVAVCTIEKANSLVNKLLDEGSIAELGAIIVDELHLLGDPSRGYILELLLTKIKYISSNSDDIQIQIIGMSATLPNLEVLANWLDAELFVTQFRPIPLDEYCLVGCKYYNKIGQCTASLDTSLTTEGDSVLNICLNTLKEGCSVLIFCMTKNWCESLAQSVASSFYKLGCEISAAGAILRNQLKTEAIFEVMEQLKNCPVGLDQVLKKTISFGVAYHHAGLTFDERDIVEGGFKSGAIRVLVATSTLSSGVNLPARKVIIRSPVFQKKPINILTYKQMIGRAGRMGKDSKGESILICTEAEKKMGFDLMMGTLDPVKSCIKNEDKFMRAVLEMIASQVVATKEQLDLYSKCTLLYNQEDISPSQSFLLETTLDELKNYELVRVQMEGEQEHYVATSLGKACLSSSMAPNDGLSLFCELQKARQCLVLETDLHLIYLVTPYSVSSQWGNIDWLHLLTLWESLTKAMKRVGELVGVQESFIIRCLRGNNKLNNIQNKVNIHKRFYTALALQDLVNEVPLAEVAAKFQCARGFLQSLQQGAATFAGMVTAFCRQLGWKNMEMLISQFQDRLHFGIHSELLELMKLPSLNGMRARTLFDSGFESISSIASADVNTIENILHKTVPFQSEKAREGDDSDDIRKRNKIKSIWITGYCGMTTKEAAENLISEARKYLSLEIGVAEIKWDNKPSETSEILNSTTNCANESPKKENSNENSQITVKIEAIDNIDTLNTTKGTVDRSSNQNHNLIGKEDDNNLIKNTSTTVDKPNYKKDIDGETGAQNLQYNNISIIHVKRETVYNLTKDDDVNENNTPGLPVKEDIMWDSLNITEAALDNITKLRTSDKMFSPNISFGEFEKSLVTGNVSENMNCSKNTSTKDISLFSSEGDNSSLFEESLPLDLIPSKLLDNDLNTLSRQETTSEYTTCLNSNTILNAFKSTLIEEEDPAEDEDIKLFYEEDKMADHLLEEAKTVEIVGIQISKDTNIDNNKGVSYKRKQNTDKEAQPLFKKKRTQDMCTLSINKTTSTNEMCNSFKINNSLSKTFVMQFNQYKVNCYLLRANDIINNLNVIESLQTASICLNIRKYSTICNEIIGSEVIQNTKCKPVRKDSLIVKGMSIYIKNDICVYLDFTSVDDMRTVNNRFGCWFKKEPLLKMLCSKTAQANIKRWIGVNLTSNCIDISLTEWLIDSSEKIPDMDFLTRKYCGIDFTNGSLKVDSSIKKFKNLDVCEMLCVTAKCVWLIAEKQEKSISENPQPAHNVIDIERQVSRILANCEYYGITVDKDLASRLLIDVRNSQETLQKKAYKLCGYHFNFNSSKDVAKVLGIDNGRKVSTKKSVLTSHNSPMSSIVIYWRKLNSILTKTLYPLTEKACIYTEGNRINPSYTMFTCTGRISMHEPNLQNVPRTFSIPSEYLTLNAVKCDDVVEFNCRNIFKAAPDYIMVSADYCQLEMRILTHFSKDPVLMKIMHSNMDVFKAIAASWSNVPEEELSPVGYTRVKRFLVGMRYIPGISVNFLGSNDYEFQGVEHYEATKFMGTDARFIRIVGLRGIGQDFEVDDDLRQKAKQLCYGIIYGMGNKTLGQLLDVTEVEAAVFMDTFYKTYPAVKAFTTSVVEDCKKNGYVETLTKRRRYLPDIKGRTAAKRSAAERQAVNTTIQGSAADIAKAAMCSIDTKTDSLVPKPRLILQMHDELIYEVHVHYKQLFISIMKKVMEETVKLSVPLPVKVRCGQTWGDLKEIKL